MNSSERLELLRQGIAALRAIERARRAVLPPPEREDGDLLRRVRDVVQLTDRLEDAIGTGGAAPEMFASDAQLGTLACDADLDLLRELAAESEEPAILDQLRQLLTRYAAGDFAPPRSYYGSATPEA